MGFVCIFILYYVNTFVQSLNSATNIHCEINMLSSDLYLFQLNFKQPSYPK